jgi:hypothetical protein
MLSGYLKGCTVLVPPDREREFQLPSVQGDYFGTAFVIDSAQRGRLLDKELYRIRRAESRPRAPRPTISGKRCAARARVAKRAMLGLTLLARALGADARPTRPPKMCVFCGLLSRPS